MNEQNPRFLSENGVVHAALGGMGWYWLVCDNERRARKDRGKTERDVDCMTCLVREARA
jgi:hypothetical protein